MKKFFYISLFIFLLLCLVFDYSNAFQKRRITKKAPKNTIQIDTFVNRRFSDTIVISANSPKIIKSDVWDLNRYYNEILSLFEKGDYNLAIQRAQFFAETIDKNDSLYFEVQFLISEALLLNGNISEGEKILLSLQENSFLPLTTKEKVLYKLGQLYCSIGYIKRSQFYFNLLATDFPKSKLLQLAKCE